MIVETIIDYHQLSRPFERAFRNFKNAFNIELLYHKDSNMFPPLNKVKPCSAGLVLGWVTNYEYPVFFSFFSPFLFQGDLLRTVIY